MQDGNQHQIQTDIHTNLAELQNHLITLKEAVEYIDEAKRTAEVSIKAMELIQKLHDLYIKLIEDVEKLLRKIEEVDFPKRLDSIDIKLTTIVSEVNFIKNLITDAKTEVIKTLNSGFDLTNKNIDTGLNISLKKIQSLDTLITTLVNELKNFHQTQIKNIKFLKVVNIFSLIFLIVIAILIYIKFYTN